MLEGKPLEGQVALITGGGTGLGRAMALKYADLGANLVIASRKIENLEPTAEEIRGRGVKCMAHALDIRDFDGVGELTAKAIEEMGQLDILVNNAAGNFLCPSDKLSINGWNAVVNIVLNGTWHVTQHVGKHMLERGTGKVLSIVATYAWTGAAMVLPSAVAKAGVLTMTRSLALEWGPRGIRLNAIAPGAIVTSGASKNLAFDSEEAQKVIAARNPLRRLGTEEEVANLAAYLVSDYSGWVNGEVISLDGGDSLGGGARFEQMFGGK